MIRILVVDDHNVVREGLVLLLRRESDFVVVAEAATAADAVELASRVQPDVVLMDVGLGDEDGIQVIDTAKIGIPCA